MDVELVAEIESLRQIRAWRGAHEVHDAIRLRERKRLEHHRVDDVEHAGRRADRERQRDDRGDEESRGTQQCARCMAEVAARILEPREALP